MTRTASDNGRLGACDGRHPHCFVCGRNPTGLQLEFAPCDGGGVESRFDCDVRYEGYPGIIHGGIVAALLDGAMTNCLFAHHHSAVTADLQVRFRHPLLPGRSAIVRARIQRDTPPLFVLSAQIVQDGQVKATAIGKFLEKEDLAR